MTILDILEGCRKHRGSGDRCNACPVKDMEICHEIMSELDKKETSLRRKDYFLSASDHLTILTNTLQSIIERCGIYQKDKTPILNTGAFVQQIFRARRSDYFKKLPRFGQLSRMAAPNPPQGLTELVEEHPDYLTLAAGILSANPDLPRSLYRQLAALSTDKQWLKKVDLLYQNTWKAQVISIDGPGSSPVPPDRQIAPDPEPQENLILKLYIRIWGKIGGTGADNCVDLFKGHGERLLDEDEERTKLAAELAMKVNTLTQKINRCYDLIRQKIIAILTEMHVPESENCVRLLSFLYGPREKGEGSGIDQRIRQTAEKFQLSEKEVNTRIRHCRKLAMARFLEVMA